jgi:hypothetical protein
MNISVGCLAKVEGWLKINQFPMIYKYLEYIFVRGISISPYSQQAGWKPAIQL